MKKRKKVVGLLCFLKVIDWGTIKKNCETWGSICVCYMMPHSSSTFCFLKPSKD